MRHTPPRAVPAMRVWLALSVLAGAVTMSAVGGAVVAAATPSIEQLEAALLITVGRFTEWPGQSFPSPTSPIVIGVISDEPLAQALEEASHGRLVGGRPVLTRRLPWDEQMNGVHMVFVGQPERRRLQPLLDPIRHRRIVTVSRLPEFGAAGGMITLRSEAGRVSFAVNARAAETAGIRFSSFLLSHAVSVGDETKAATR